MMSKQIMLLLLLAVAAHSLQTSSFQSKRGVEVHDQVLQQQSDSALFIQTSCSDVDLSVPPFNHNDVVMSGYLNINKGGSALGFVFYGKEGATRTSLKNYPTILWLNGGPAVSSLRANFMELGPHIVRPATMAPYEVVKNNYTWIKECNVLFVDNPVGTGLSYADPTYSPGAFCKNTTEGANDLYYALKELYMNPNGCFNKLGFIGANPLFVFGQSYGGKFAAGIAQKIKYEQLHNGGFLTGLKGVGIGSGFLHPSIILKQAGEFSFNLGLIDYQDRQIIERILLNATYQERTGKWRDLHDTQTLVGNLITNMSGGVNVFDMTKYGDYPFELINSFAESPDIKKRFAFNPEIPINNQFANVYESLYENFMHSEVHLVEMLLEDKVNVLVYNGQNDIAVPVSGTFKWVELLHHPFADQFRDTLLQPWKVNGKMAGFHKIVGNLEIRTINDAGHLAPLDQRENSFQMVKSFVQRSL